jgi:MoaA/NifB/PqqE/SkfB family radical SAM enzyme
MNLKRIWHSVQVMRRHRFDFLIFFITGKCNARCRHCFYWKNLGPTHAGPSLAEIESLARSMPAFRLLVIGGGEPTLRDDLTAVVDLFRRHNKVEDVVIPTNGLLPDRIAQLAAGLAQIDPELRIAVHLSLDGFAETHDRLRGVPGAFDRVIEAAALLSALRDSCPNLRLVVNTVILAANLDEIVPLASFLREELSLDNHTFEIIRGKLIEERLKQIPPDRLRQILEQVFRFQDWYTAREIESMPVGIGRLWWRVSAVGVLAYQYRLQWKVFAEAGRWDFPCQAGEAIGVVDYNGEYRVCELREQAVPLSEFEWNFERARSSRPMVIERRIAKQHTCDCTHMCFLTASLKQSIRARFLIVPLHFLKYKLTGRIW